MSERSRVTIRLAFAISTLLLSPAGLPDTAFQDGPAAGARKPELPQILAFDLPPDLHSQADQAKIRSFVVGYFQGEGAEPRWILEVPPSLTRVVADGSVHLVLPFVSDLPPGVYSARLKIRTTVADSDWSAPSPSFTLPELVKLKARSTPSSSRKPEKVPPPLKLDASLVAAVGPLLPKGMDVTDATQGFKKPLPFISALFVARNLGLEFAAVKEKIFEKPGKTRSLSSVIGELRPDRDAKAEARKAAKQARQLEGAAARKRRPEPPKTWEWLPAEGILSSLDRTPGLRPGWLQARGCPRSSLEFTSAVVFGCWHGVRRLTGVPTPVVETLALGAGGRA